MSQDKSQYTIQYLFVYHLQYRCGFRAFARLVLSSSRNSELVGIASISVWRHIIWFEARTRRGQGGGLLTDYGRVKEKGSQFNIGGSAEVKDTQLFSRCTPVEFACAACHFPMCPLKMLCVGLWAHYHTICVLVWLAMDIPCLAIAPFLGGGVLWIVSSSHGIRI